jgi:hypothetical protein
MISREQMTETTEQVLSSSVVETVEQPQTNRELLHIASDEYMGGEINTTLSKDNVFRGLVFSSPLDK